jgi:stage III sporulation protein SpoIIIAA
MEFHSKPAVQPSATGLMVGVIEENLDEVTLIDELTAKEEHVAVVIHILEVGLKGICAALARRSRIGGIMVEQRVPGKC